VPPRIQLPAPPVQYAPGRRPGTVTFQHLGPAEPPTVILPVQRRSFGSVLACSSRSHCLARQQRVQPALHTSCEARTRPGRRGGKQRLPELLGRAQISARALTRCPALPPRRPGWLSGFRIRTRLAPAVPVAGDYLPGNGGQWRAFPALAIPESAFPTLRCNCPSNDKHRSTASGTPRHDLHNVGYSTKHYQ
jgi:hypothetical protein